MKEARPLLGLALIVALTAGCPAADEKAPPGITAQGFELSQPRAAEAGAFSDVRIRFEVPLGIEHLVVRERSFEVDLAKSPEASYFPLFGIDRRVWSKRDVTLDFAGYLNEKIQRPGRYVLAVEVADRDGRTSHAELKIEVRPPAESEVDGRAEAPAGSDAGDGAEDASPSAHGGADSARVPDGAARLQAERPFRLQRVGAGPVEGADPFGITWKTVDAIDVVIRIEPRAGRPARLARVDPVVYRELATRNELGRLLDRVDWVDALEIPTANDAASGAVFAVVRADERYLLRTDRSTTSLSDLGTTVTLSGSYRD